MSALLFQIVDITQSGIFLHLETSLKRTASITKFEHKHLLNNSMVIKYTKIDTKYQ